MSACVKFYNVPVRLSNVLVAWFSAESRLSYKNGIRSPTRFEGKEHMSEQKLTRERNVILNTIT